MKRSKIFIFLLLVCLLTMPFTGCANDDFVTVCKVVYTTRGETKTQASTAFIDYSEPTFITEDEYNESPEGQRITGKASSYNLSPNFTIPKGAEGKLSYTAKPTETDSEKLTRYYKTYHDLAGKWIYAKVKYMGIDYSFIQVKVVDSSTIVIKDKKGETTYKVTSYSITYFNN